MFITDEDKAESEATTLFPGFFVALASAVYVHVKHVKADEEARRTDSRA